MSSDPENMANESIKAAYYYYKMGLTQDEIAKRMFMSRQRVNRILKKCVETGIVKITIQDCRQRSVELEEQLERQFDINEIIVVKTDPDGNPYTAVGSEAAAYLDRVLQNNMIVGFSRGRALSAVVDHLSSTNKTQLTITQLLGGLNAEDRLLNSDSLVQRASETLHAKPCFMYVPILLENEKLRDALLKESIIEQTYKTMKACDIAVVGIGDMSEKSHFWQKQFVSNDDLRYLKQNQAVGEVCTHYFDMNGTLIKSGIEKCALAIDYESYRKIPIRIGVGCGAEKIKAIVGAVRGHYINVLITDKETAEGVDQTVASQEAEKL